MVILFRKKFKKQYDKFDLRIKDRIDNRIKIFEKDPFNIILNNHRLQGKLNNHRSINITGNIRAIYVKEKGGVIRFIKIGTHNELYE